MCVDRVEPTRLKSPRLPLVTRQVPSSHSLCSACEFTNQTAGLPLHLRHHGQNAHEISPNRAASVTAENGSFNRIRQVAPVCTPSDTWFLWLTRVYTTTKIISIDLAVFDQQPARQLDRQTDRQTTLRIDINSNSPHLALMLAMQPAG